MTDLSNLITIFCSFISNIRCLTLSIKSLTFYWFFHDEWVNAKRICIWLNIILRILPVSSSLCCVTTCLLDSSLEFLCHDNEWWCKMIIFAYQIITFISYFVNRVLPIFQTSRYLSELLSIIVVLFEVSKNGFRIFLAFIETRPGQFKVLG